MNHKHKYIITNTKTPFKIEFKNNQRECNDLFGIKVVCCVCGKENRTFSKKLREINKNTLNFS